MIRDGLPPVQPGRRHLLSIADVTREDVERLLGLAESFERTLEREVKKLPTLKRPPRRQRLLRVVDPHLVELRARREAALRRHDVDQGGRLVGRQGRVAEGHGADALAPTTPT